MPRKTSKSSQTRANFSPRFISNIKSQNWQTKTQVDVARLKKNLNQYRQKTKVKFQKKHPHVVDWLAKKSLSLSTIRQHSQRLLTGASLSATLLLSAPTSPATLPAGTSQVRLAEAGYKPTSSIASRFLNNLSQLVPKRIGHLDPDQENQVAQLIKDDLGIVAGSTLEDQRLNHSLGWIGYEQHLKRFPGDSLSQHDAEQQAGIAPGLGAWGYFASSKSALTQEAIQKEKYYVAVQTMYLPTWKKNLKYLVNWYKHRKVLVVNVDNGTAVVAVIGDSGPAAWTGKQFGGSPELMRSLDLTGKKSKGKVLIYFVDDPENKVPLGPITKKLGQEVKLT